MNMSYRNRNIWRAIRKSFEVVILILILNIISKVYLAIGGFITFIQYAAKKEIDDIQIITLISAFLVCIVIDYCIDVL